MYSYYGKVKCIERDRGFKKIAFFKHFVYFKSGKSSESSAPNIYLLLFSTVINIYITCIE